MSDMLKVQAVRQGISLARLEVLQGLGISLNDAPLFKEYKNDELKALKDLGLDGNEMVRYYRRAATKWSVGSFHGLDVYASVRKMYSEDEITSLPVSVWDLEGAITNGLSKDEIWHVTADEINLYRYVEAKEIGVSYDDLRDAEANGWSTTPYFEARRLGYSHAEVSDFMALVEKDTRFYLSEYVWLRSQTGTQHSQVMEMMDATAGKQHARGYYVDYRKADYPHDRALELVKLAVYPNHYYYAIREASHSEVLDVVRAGIGLESYAKLRANSPRTKHHEIIEYRYVSGRLDEHGINSYLRLLDSGIEYEAILTLSKAGFSLFEIKRLLGTEFGLRPEQAREVAEVGLTVMEYAALRDSGMAHGQIIKAALKDRPDHDVSD